MVENKFDDLPEIIDSSSPWELFSDTTAGIISQMQKKIGADEIFIHPSAKIGEFVTMEAPCYIGKNVEIRPGAYLRKGSWICEGSLVGHSTEIKNSILMPGSKAPHFNYVGDSILGSKVNLGAGTKLSNIRNDRRDIIVTLGDGERKTTGLKKMGAIIGENSQLGCNVVTNPGSILATNSMVPPNETVTGWFQS
tara:strand:- start:306 stop:887 length:582 start_codon:yes stop_codon:yes gene_type:complete